MSKLVPGALALLLNFALFAMALAQRAIGERLETPGVMVAWRHYIR